MANFFAKEKGGSVLTASRTMTAQHQYTSSSHEPRGEFRDLLLNPRTSLMQAGFVSTGSVKSCSGSAGDVPVCVAQSCSSSIDGLGMRKTRSSLPLASRGPVPVIFRKRLTGTSTNNWAQ
jgi:hypothetical protein